MAHIEVMADRPCKLDPDVKWLWNKLLPGTASPVCGTAGDSNSAQKESTESQTETPPEPQPRRLA
jgi:hypothetical protein